MKTLDCQKQDVVNKTRSNLFGWGGQFTAKFKPLEIERCGNYGGFATIKRQAGEPCLYNPVEFDGIRNLDRNHFTQMKP